MIREYWAALGYVVTVDVKRADFGEYIVSDLVNGLPRDWLGQPKGKPPEESYMPQEHERPCLSCGKQFLSKGFHNRLCHPCRTSGSGP
jgi:hypothetical protein